MARSESKAWILGLAALVALAVGWPRVQMAILARVFGAPGERLFHSDLVLLSGVVLGLGGFLLAAFLGGMVEFLRGRAERPVLLLAVFLIAPFVVLGIESTHCVRVGDGTVTHLGGARRAATFPADELHLRIVIVGGSRGMERATNAIEFPDGDQFTNVLDAQGFEAAVDAERSQPLGYWPRVYDPIR